MVVWCRPLQADTGGPLSSITSVASRTRTNSLMLIVWHCYSTHIVGNFAIKIVTTGRWRISPVVSGHEQPLSESARPGLPRRKRSSESSSISSRFFCSFEEFSWLRSENEQKKRPHELKIPQLSQSRGFGHRAFDLAVQYLKEKWHETTMKSGPKRPA